MIAEGIACFLIRKFSFQVVKISVEDHNPPRLTQIVHFIEKAASFTEVIKIYKIYYFTDILRNRSLACQPSLAHNRTCFQLQSGSKQKGLKSVDCFCWTGGSAKLHCSSLQGWEGQDWGYDLCLAHVQVDASVAIWCISAVVIDFFYLNFQANLSHWRRRRWIGLHRLMNNFRIKFVQSIIYNSAWATFSRAFCTCNNLKIDRISHALIWKSK